MGLDVDTPEPPALRGPQAPADYDAVDEGDDVDAEGDEVGDDARREAIAGFLADGAWERAFGEWVESTLLSEDQFALAVDLGLVDRLDFYWNQAAGDVGYRVPEVPSPEALPAAHAEDFDRGDLGDLEEELDALARTVTEVLEDEYVDADAGEFGFYADADGPDDG